VARVGGLALVFALAFATFIVGPAFLARPFGAFPLLRDGDVLDLFTSLALIPIYWLLFQRGGASAPGRRETLAFVVLAALWAQGQGMHLAANAIGHLTRALPGADVDTLTVFLDETLSHYVWHTGMVGLSALIMLRQWRSPIAGEGASDEGATLRLPIGAGVLHGISYAITIIEADTAPLTASFAAIAALLVLARRPRRLRERPAVAFFFTAYLVATICIAGWGAYWRGLPEFSEVGIID
jgi:hypothetical protein